MEALKILTTIEPCIILLDMVMPKMDGMEVLSRMKELKITIPVVIQSGSKRFDTGHTWLSKPFDTDQIVKAVNSHCKAKVHHAT